ncbi:mercuric transporter MerT family protein [Litorimonas sp.]|jgi:mercuric ion transport protein|uniref:mercuric transporter MerT family protein n=1 Tax=Litorimonas sp. TaxID=1892381 RepID=UPI003A884AF7
MNRTKQFRSEPQRSIRRRRLFATGGVVGALLASSCCIVPLILISMGVSGAWIGNFTALEPYKPIFVGIAVLFIGAGFWHVYFKKTDTCEDGSYCAKPQSSRLTKLVLWLATFAVILALTIDYWAPLFY